MLVICPTPIGNLDDTTTRQREALANADVIACEDTRRAGKLLELLGIERVDGRPRLHRYDDHTAEESTGELLALLRAGKNVVLTSDAGTPTISDPGYRLVKACRHEGIEVTALPGPVAALVALSGSGLPTDRFFFEGFLPTGTEKRRERLEGLDELEVTVIIYASPHRIVDVLDDVQTVIGPERSICVARELTKMHEEYLVDDVESVRNRLQQRDELHGEIVLCIAPAESDDEDEDSTWLEADRAIKAMDEQGLRSRTIKDIVDELYDVPRSDIYDRIDAVTGDDS